MLLQLKTLSTDPLEGTVVELEIKTVQQNINMTDSQMKTGKLVPLEFDY